MYNHTHVFHPIKSVTQMNADIQHQDTLKRSSKQGLAFMLHSAEPKTTSYNEMTT